MDPGDLVLRHGEHAERVFGAQVLLGGEGEVAEVGQFAQVRRVDAGVVELALVQRDAVVGVGHGVLQAAELERLELVAGDGFLAVQDGVERWRRQGFLGHLWFPGFYFLEMVRLRPRNSAMSSPRGVGGEFAGSWRRNRAGGCRLRCRGRSARSAA